MSELSFPRLNKHSLALLIIVIFWAIFSLSTGTMTSGFHFTDDHEILSFHSDIERLGTMQTMKDAIKKDLDIRFRPFYYIHRVFLTKIFQTNFLLWSIHHYVLAACTSFLLFLFLYVQGYKFTYALAFPFLVLIGTQTAIWWRLGPTETIGMLLLAGALFFLANAIYKKKSYQLIISFFLLILASLSKESFTLFVPAYVIIYLTFKLQTTDETNILKIMRQNALIIFLAAAIFISEIYIILFKVGANEIGYAGFDGFSLSGLSKFASVHIKHNLQLYLLIFLELLCLIPLIKLANLKPKNLTKKQIVYIYQIVILASIVLPQYVLHLKSGLYERYLLPLNLGLGLFIIFLLNEIMKTEKKALLSKKTLLILFACIGLSIPIFYASYKAKQFTKEGRSTHLFLSSIKPITNTDDSILVVLDGYENFEWGHSMDKYLKLNVGMKKIKYLVSDAQINEDYALGLRTAFSNRFKKNMVSDIDNNYTYIAILPHSGSYEIEERLNNNSFYKRDEFGDFSLYAKIHK